MKCDKQLSNKVLSTSLKDSLQRLSKNRTQADNFTELMQTPNFDEFKNDRIDSKEMQFDEKLSNNNLFKSLKISSKKMLKNETQADDFTELLQTPNLDEFTDDDKKNLMTSKENGIKVKCDKQLSNEDLSSKNETHADNFTELMQMRNFDEIFNDDKNDSLSSIEFAVNCSATEKIIKRKLVNFFEDFSKEISKK